MLTPLGRCRKNHIYKLLSWAIIFSFLSNTIFPAGVMAQALPLAQPLVVSGFNPIIIQGLTIDPQNPLQMDFIVDKGNQTNSSEEEIKNESLRLIKYFLASLTVPEGDLWVNLSPYEKDRIIPNQFGGTEMGRDLLAQDYILKQLTATLMSPEDKLGDKFWKKIRQKTKEKFGTTNIPVDTFHKIWIIPDEATVYEHDQSAFVVQTHLKVMLEEDYKALMATNSAKGSKNLKEPGLDQKMSTEIIRQIIIPEIEKEVNHGKQFANLRQIYNSMILATWFKNTLKENLLSQVYADKNKIRGVDIDDKKASQKIYEQYLEAFKKGVYDYIKEDYDAQTQDVISRKYFSGGLNLALMPRQALKVQKNFAMLSPADQRELVEDKLNVSASFVEMAPGVSSQDVASAMSIPRAPPLVSPIVYPKTTAQGWHQDIISLITSSDFMALAKRGGYQGDSWDSAIDIGVGAVPLTSLELFNALKKQNPNVKFVGTEIGSALPSAHVVISQGPILEKFKEIAARHLKEEFRQMQESTGLKSVPWVPLDNLLEVRLVVDANGRVNEILAGVEENGRLWYNTLAVSPDAKFIMAGKEADSSWKNVEIFEEFVNGFLAANKFDSMFSQAKAQKKDEVRFDLNPAQVSSWEMLEEAKEDIRGITVVFNPVQQALKKAGAEFVLTEDLSKIEDTYSVANIIPNEEPTPAQARGIGQVSWATANYVSAHMTKEESEAFLNMAKKILKPGGILTLKNAISVLIDGKDQKMDKIDVYQRQGDNLVYLGTMPTYQDNSLVGDQRTFNEIMSRNVKPSALEEVYLFSQEVKRKQQQKRDDRLFAVNKLSKYIGSPVLFRLAPNWVIGGELESIEDDQVVINNPRFPGNGYQKGASAISIPLTQALNIIEGQDPDHFINELLASQSTPPAVNRAMLSSAPETKVVGFFPGLGSRDAYRNLGSELYDKGGEKVKAIYKEAAEALGFTKDGAPDVTKIFMNDENLPQDNKEKLGFVGAAFLVHNLALHAYFEEQSKKLGTVVQFEAYTGESMGILIAAAASGSLSVGDAVKLAQFYTPNLLRYSEQEIKEDYHVVGIKRGNIAEVIDGLNRRFPGTVEVHKYFSSRPTEQVNVYVADSVRADFDAFMKASYPTASVSDLKPPTRFIAHSKKMAGARAAFERFIEENNIKFNRPRVPVISNSSGGVLAGAQEIRDATLDIVDQPMNSRETVQDADVMNTDFILEFGLGGKTEVLIQQNFVRTAFQAFTGDDIKNNDILTGMKLLHSLKAEFNSFSKSNAEIILPHQYNLLRYIFPYIKRNAFLREALLNYIHQLVEQNLLLDDKKRKCPAFYKYLEIIQNTYMVHNILDMSMFTDDTLVSSAIFKRRVGREVNQESEKVDIDLVLLNPDDQELQVTFRDYKYPEVVTFSFNRLSITGPEITEKIMQLYEGHASAREMMDEIARRIGETNFKEMLGRLNNLGQAYLHSFLMITYQFVLFNLTQIHRPAILGQNFYYAGGSDRVGIMTALAVSGALSITDALELDLALEHRSLTRWMEVMQKVQINKPSIKVIDPRTNTLVNTVSGVRDLLNYAATNPSEARLVDLNMPGWTLSYDPTQTTTRTTQNADINTIYVTAFDQIWRQTLNQDLDLLNTLSVLRLTDQNRRVYQFAEGRGTTTANVYAYVNPGENVIGFGKGGSESLTIFVVKPGETAITVRKVLSERLITTLWDRNGQGVMLPPFVKAKRQAEFLQGLPQTAQGLFPKVSDVEERDLPIPPGTREFDKYGGKYHELIYDMDFIPGEEVSEFIRQHKPLPQVVAKIYLEIFKMLYTRVHSNRRDAPKGPTLESSYFKKIEDRLALSQRQAPNVFNDKLLGSEYIYINGERYLNVRPLLEKLRGHPEFLEILEPHFHSLVMGDTNTENIKITRPEVILAAMERGDTNFTGEDIGIKFLDPRAIGFHVNGQDTGADDPMYDNKPWHNSVGNYDIMHGEHFDLRVSFPATGPQVSIISHEDNPYQSSYKGMEKYFKEVMTEAWQLNDPNSQFLKDDPYWLIRFVFMMGTHFTAMPPFHFKTDLDGKMIDDYEHQIRPVAIYAEGIKWLNWAVEMLEGQKTEFNGFKVPPLPYTPEGQNLSFDFANAGVIATNGKNSAMLNQMGQESRIFTSPWTRFVRGFALGQYPMEYDPKIAQNIRKTLEVLKEKVSPENSFNNFSNLLTDFILDVNDPLIRLSDQDLTSRIDNMAQTISTISNPSLFTTATAVLLDSLVKLELNPSLLLAKHADLVETSLAKLREIPVEEGEKGSYEKLQSYSGLLLSLGQAGMKDRLITGDINYVQEALDLVGQIPSAFYRGRGASQLFSVLHLLGYDAYIFDGKTDHLKALLDYLNEKLDKYPDLKNMEKRASFDTYPLLTLLNSMALLGRSEYLTYQRDWLEEAKVLTNALPPSQRISQGQYYLMALYNLGKLDQYVPNVRRYLKDNIELYLSTEKQGVFEKDMHDSYLLETAWLFNMVDLVPESLIQRMVDNFRNYSKGELYLNSAYGAAYVLSALGEAGRADQFFDPRLSYNGESPLFWTIRNFSDGAKDETITLPYLNHALISYALRMRGTNHKDEGLFKGASFIADGTKNISEEDAMRALSEGQRIELVQKALDTKFESSLGKTTKPLEPLGGGFQTYNRPFKVITNKGIFVIKREGVSKEKAQVVVSASNLAKKNGLNYVVEMLANDDGEILTEIHGHYYSVQPFVIASNEVTPQEATAKHWEQAVGVMVDLHEALRGAEVGSQAVAVPHDPRISVNQQDLETIYTQIKSRESSGQQIGAAEKAYLNIYPTIQEQISILRETLSEQIYDNLPKGFIHGDLRFKNMYFDDQGNLEHLFDFGHAGYAPRIRDFVGLFVYNTGTPFNYQRLVNSVALYNQRSAHPLSDEEIKAIPEVLRGTWLEFVKVFFGTPEFGLEKLNQDPKLLDNIQTKLKRMFELIDAFPSANSRERFLQDVKVGLGADKAMLDTGTSSSASTTQGPFVRTAPVFLISGANIYEQEKSLKAFFDTTALKSFITDVRIDRTQSDDKVLFVKMNTTSGEVIKFKLSSGDPRATDLRIREFKVAFGETNDKGREMQAAYSDTRKLSEDVLLALLVLAKQNNVKVVSTGLGIPGSDRFFTATLGQKFARFHDITNGVAFEMIPTGFQVAGRLPGELVDVKNLNIYLDNWNFPTNPFAVDQALLVKAPYTSLDQMVQSLPQDIAGQLKELSKTLSPSDQKEFAQRFQAADKLIALMRRVYGTTMDDLITKNYHNHLHNLAVTFGSLTLNGNAGTIRNLDDLTISFLAGLFHDFHVRELADPKTKAATFANVNETLGTMDINTGAILSTGGQLADLFGIREYTASAVSDALYGTLDGATKQEFQTTIAEMIGDADKLKRLYDELSVVIRRTDFPSDVIPTLPKYQPLALVIRSLLDSEIERLGTEDIDTIITTIKAGFKGLSNQMTGDKELDTDQKRQIAATWLERKQYIELAYLQALKAVDPARRMQVHNIALHTEFADQSASVWLVDPIVTEKITEGLSKEQTFVSFEANYPFFYLPQLLANRSLKLIRALPDMYKRNFVNTLEYAAISSTKFARSLRYANDHPEDHSADVEKVRERAKTINFNVAVLPVLEASQDGWMSLKEKIRKEIDLKEEEWPASLNSGIVIPSVAALGNQANNQQSQLSVEDPAIAAFGGEEIEGPEPTVDAAQVAEPVGGINLNPTLLNLQIKRDGKGRPLPVQQQPIFEMKIEGFMPIIINITPANNMPLLLGVNTTTDNKNSFGQNYPSDPAETRRTNLAQSAELSLAN